MLIIANLECKPAFGPSCISLNFVSVCVISKRKRGAGSVTVRRPVPVPFPVL